MVNRLGAGSKSISVRYAPHLCLRATPELTQGNRKSQFHEFAGELTSKVNPTTSHVVNDSNCQTQLLFEESRVVGAYFAFTINYEQRRRLVFGPERGSCAGRGLSFSGFGLRGVLCFYDLST